MDIAPKAKKQRKRMSKRAFYGYWIAAYLVVLLIVFAISIALDYLFTILNIPSIYYLIPMTILAFGSITFIQKWIIKKFTGWSFKGWVWSAMLGSLVSLIIVLIVTQIPYEPADIDSPFVLFLNFLLWTPVISFPAIAQAFILSRYVGGAYWYAIVSIVLGLLILIGYITFFLFPCNIIATVLLFVFAQSYTLIRLFINHRRRTLTKHS